VGQFIDVEVAPVKSSGVKTETLERASYVATISAAILAVIALVFGYWQFSDTQHAQRDTLQLEREAKAIELTLKFRELATAGGMKTDRTAPDEQAIVIAESIFDLVGDDPGWKATVRWMVEEETPYMKNHHLGCDSFNSGFIAYVKTISGPEICE
jgi:hypothetical protein